jgi:hypothetical protein
MIEWIKLQFFMTSTKEEKSVKIMRMDSGGGVGLNRPRQRLMRFLGCFVCDAAADANAAAGCMLAC